VSKENIYYEVAPRIFTANTRSKVTIRPLFSHWAFAADAQYLTAFIPAGGYPN